MDLTPAKHAKALEDVARGEEVFRYVKDIMGLDPTEAMIAMAAALGATMSRCDAEITPRRIDVVFNVIRAAWQADQNGEFSW